MIYSRRIRHLHFAMHNFKNNSGTTSLFVVSFILCILVTIACDPEFEERKNWGTLDDGINQKDDKQDFFHSQSRDEDSLDCVTDIVYRSNGETNSKLRNSLQQGDTVSAAFRISDGCRVQLSLVSYTAAEPFWNPNTAHEQVLFDEDSEYFGPGNHQLTVSIPDCNFQVDFVTGPSLGEQPPFYGDRLIDADNGGQKECSGIPSTNGEQVDGDDNNNGGDRETPVNESNDEDKNAPENEPTQESEQPEPNTPQLNHASLRHCVNNIIYIVNGRRSEQLRDHVNQGETVAVSFSIRNYCKVVQLSLASYTAPEPYWNPETAHKQEVVEEDTGFFRPGNHQLTVDVPPCFFQVDFVLGPAIGDGPPFYGDRLIDADNSGWMPCWSK